MTIFLPEYPVCILYHIPLTAYQLTAYPLTAYCLNTGMVDFLRFPRSLTRASRALVNALRQEPNFRLQLIFAGVVLLAAAWLRVRWIELLLLLLAVGLVPVLELMNSAVERLVDVVHPRLHSYAATIKDLLAGAVLLSALLALAVAVMILLPYLVAW